MDTVYLLALLVFFVLSAALVRAFDRLRSRP